MEIAVELGVNGGPAVARIGDTGRPFDPTQVAPPALATSLVEAQFWRHPFDAQLWGVALWTSRRLQLGHCNLSNRRSYYANADKH
jgi:hypothetical protein